MKTHGSQLPRIKILAFCDANHNCIHVHLSRRPEAFGRVRWNGPTWGSGPHVFAVLVCRHYRNGLWNTALFRTLDPPCGVDFMWRDGSGVFPRACAQRALATPQWRRVGGRLLLRFSLLAGSRARSDQSRSIAAAARGVKSDRGAEAHSSTLKACATILSQIFQTFFHQVFRAGERITGARVELH